MKCNNFKRNIKFLSNILKYTDFDFWIKIFSLKKRSHVKNIRNIEEILIFFKVVE